VDRTYRVKLRGNVTEDRLERWRKGMRIDGKPTLPARVHVVSRVAQGATVQVTLVEGQNRHIHRLAEAVGLTASKIHRMRYASIALGTLQPGHYRELMSTEVKKLRRSVGLR
jgi:pseudouridine synthase